MRGCSCPKLLLSLQRMRDVGGDGLRLHNAEGIDLLERIVRV